MTDTSTMTSSETVAAVRDYWEHPRPNREHLDELGERLKRQAGDMAAAGGDHPFLPRVESAKDAQERFERRSVRWRVDADGNGRISAQLPPEDLAVVVAAFAALLDTLGEDQPVPRAERSWPGGMVPSAEAGAPEAPVVLEEWRCCRSRRAAPRPCG